MKAVSLRSNIHLTKPKSRRSSEQPVAQRRLERPCCCSPFPPSCLAAAAVRAVGRLLAVRSALRSGNAARADFDVALRRRICR